jgi:hypothetical protein
VGGQGGGLWSWHAATHPTDNNHLGFAWGQNVQGHCIQAVKDKALEILAAAPRKHPGAITRVVSERCAALRQLAATRLTHAATGPCQWNPLPTTPAPTCLQAFVGYRDFYREAGGGHFVVHDFVDSKSFRQACAVVQAGAPAPGTCGLVNAVTVSKPCLPCHPPIGPTLQGSPMACLLQ